MRDFEVTGMNGTQVEIHRRNTDEYRWFDINTLINNDKYDKD